MIDFNRPWTTRGGAEVKIYARYEEGMYPIHGACKNDNGIWIVTSWTKEGYQIYSDSPINSEFDLVNVGDGL